MALENFLDDVYNNKCKIRKLFTEKELSDIESSVRELVWTILSKAKSKKIHDLLKLDTHEQVSATFGDIFPISKLIPVGSFYEGTRIGNPFEFDFMMLIDINDLEIGKGCGPGLYKISRPKNKHWNEFLESTFLENGHNNYEKRSVSTIFDNLYGLLSEGSLLTETEKMIEKSTGTLKCSLGIMLELTFQWIPNETKDIKTQISVDTMPAFQFPTKYIKDEVSEVSSSIWSYFSRDEKCYLVTKPCDNKKCTTCFQVSFASFEKTLMKEMDEIHKKCYTILKHLIIVKSDTDDSLTEVSSYKLKNCLLHHVFMQGTCTMCTKKDIGKCTVDVIEKLIQCYEGKGVPKFFQKQSYLHFNPNFVNGNLDVIVPDDNIIRTLFKNCNTKTLRDVINTVAWLEFTKSHLVIFRELLIALRKQSIDSYIFSSNYKPFECIASTLKNHITDSSERALAHNLTGDYLKIGQQMCIPMLYLLQKCIPDDLVFEGLQFNEPPVPILELDMLDEKVMDFNSQTKKEKKSFFVYLTSGWFTIQNTDTDISDKCSGNFQNIDALVYHRDKISFSHDD